MSSAHRVIVLFAGVAAAVVSGAMLGGAMRPALVTDRPEGPQMFATWAGDRSTGPFDPGTTFVAYGPNAPDYVMGADWKKRMAWPDEPAAAAPSARDDVADDDTRVSQDASLDAAPIVVRAAYEDAPAPAHDYPSLGGAAASAEPPPAADAPPDPPADSG